jgi:16S rRNA (cytidine1402-2'-O)-methyltransferase
MNNQNLGTLYVVATPIGNLEDMTFRAVRLLKEADAILCEDTRTTGKLLKHYDISNKTISYHAQSRLSRTEEIIELIRNGKNLALVSDAGTPGISDPGSQLINKARKEFGPKLKIIAIPGPSALISALSVSGFTGNSFIYEGFLPHKKGRETIFKKIASSNETHAFYESPHRIIKTLESLEKYIPERKIMIAREITKMFEENLIGTPDQILKMFEDNPEKVRGEFVVIVFDK